MCGSNIAIYRQRKINLTDGLGMVAQLMIDDAKQVETVKVIGPGFQDFLISLLRFCKSAGTVKDHCLIQQ